MISLSALNPEQRLAASTTEGPVLILAGAGSGKTRTITYRMAYMVSNLHVDPKKILAVSFTNKAAKEMKERVANLLPRSKVRGMTLATFHSLGVRILKNEIQHLGYHQNFSIYDPGDQSAIIREALKNYRSDKAQFDRKVILSKISNLKNRGIPPDEFAHSKFFNAESPYDLATEYCYRFYQEKLQFYNAIDFDDILFLVVKIFKENPERAKFYSEKYQYIMIDEYQDTNTLQFQIVLALTSVHKNICVVGDDDQAIYAFRGADIGNILSFEKHFPGAKVVKLEENYRSTRSILELANQVIVKNPKRRQKTLRGLKDGPKPLVWSSADSDHESELVIEDIVQYQSGGGHLGEVAILFRSKTQVGPFEDQLRMSQIPYSFLGGQKLYDKKEIKDLMAYMCLLFNPKDELAMRRVLNVPNRGIGQATLNKFLDIREKNKYSLYDAILNFPDLDSARSEGIRDFLKKIDFMQNIFAQKPLSEALGIMLEELNYMEYLKKQYEGQEKILERKKADIMRFLESADRFTRLYKESATLEKFVEKIILADNQDKENDNEEDEDISKNQVTLMTLHSAKGLEFDIVYFVGAEEELMPHKKSVEEGTDVSEELRLCYVGITRAREKLVLTYCKERKLYGKMVPRRKSRFLEGLDEAYIEQDRTTFGHLTPEEAQNYKKSFFNNLVQSLED